MIALISLFISLLPIALCATIFVVAITCFMKAFMSTTDSDADESTLMAHPLVEEDSWFLNDVPVSDFIISTAPVLKTAEPMMTFAHLMNLIANFVALPFIIAFRHLKRFAGDVITNIDLAIEKPLGSILPMPLLAIGALSTFVALALTTLALDGSEHRLLTETHTMAPALCGVIMLMAAIALAIQATGQMFSSPEHETESSTETPVQNMGPRLVYSANASLNRPPMTSANRHPHFWLPTPHLPRGRDGPGSFAH